MNAAKLVRSVFKLFIDPTFRFNILSNIGLYDNMPDEKYLKKKFKAFMGADLDLDTPRTFNEKIQWLKLYDRNPQYTIMVDKYLSKSYVGNIIGKEYIVPLLGEWDKAEDIDFDGLPEKFVLKTNHDCGGLVICKDKNSFDKENAIKLLNKHLKNDYYLSGREWPYKNVKRKIFAEEYLEDSETRELRDYKFFCFNGEVKALFIASDRQEKDAETKFDFFDTEFNRLPFTNGHPNSAILPKRPERFEEMKLLASKLSKGIPHLRVDFYEVNGRVYFGELTFSHWSGFVPFEPEEWDYTFGSWIELPRRRS